MSGYRQRRHPATAWPIAALLAALVFCGLAGGRAVEPAAKALRSALTATQTSTHDGAHGATGRSPRGKATTLLATTASGLDAPSRAAVLAASASLLVIAALVVWPRRRRVGRMHAGR